MKATITAEIPIQLETARGLWHNDKSRRDLILYKHGRDRCIIEAFYSDEIALDCGAVQHGLNQIYIVVQ
jgi:hypothetical protein